MDSTGKQVFVTGAVRDTTEGKERLDLVSPVFLSAFNSAWKTFKRLRTFAHLPLQRQLESILDKFVEFRNNPGILPSHMKPLMEAAVMIGVVIHQQKTNNPLDTFKAVSPYVLKVLGDWLRIGANKYSDRNWEKGIPINRSLASAERHLNKLRIGMKDEDHAAAVLCNIMFIQHTAEMIDRGVLPTELYDMPDYGVPQQKKNGSK